MISLAGVYRTEQLTFKMCVWGSREEREDEVLKYYIVCNVLYKKRGPKSLRPCLNYIFPTPNQATLTVR